MHTAGVSARTWEVRLIMGRINSVFSHYFQDRERFADLFNGICFQGKTIIRAEELTCSTEVYHQPETEEPGRQRKRKWMERVRDIKMNLKTGGTLRILALENSVAFVLR